MKTPLFTFLGVIKPVDKARLSDVISYVEANGWAEYRPILELGYAILTEMERFNH